MNEHRLFVAIAVPQDIKNLIVRERDKLGLSIRLIPPENFHLTALFMGNVPDKEIVNVQKEIAETCEKISAFTLELSSITARSKNGKHMLWGSFNPSSDYEKLCLALAKALNIEMTKAPRPHITLARSKEKIAGSFPIQFEQLSFVISNLELWESTISSKGSVYNSLFNFPLANP